jgi:hypothetical protein
LYADGTLPRAILTTGAAMRTNAGAKTGQLNAVGNTAPDGSSRVIATARRT